MILQLAAYLITHVSKKIRSKRLKQARNICYWSQSNISNFTENLEWEGDKTMYFCSNIKVSISQLDKLKSAKKKNGTGVVLILSSNMTGVEETSFPRKLWLTDWHVPNDVKLSKIQISQTNQMKFFVKSFSHQ